MLQTSLTTSLTVYVGCCALPSHRGLGMGAALANEMFTDATAAANEPSVRWVSSLWGLICCHGEDAPRPAHTRSGAESPSRGQSGSARSRRPLRVLVSPVRPQSCLASKCFVGHRPFAGVFVTCPTGAMNTPPAKDVRGLGEKRSHTLWFSHLPPWAHNIDETLTRSVPGSAFNALLTFSHQSMHWGPLVV